MDAVDDAFGSLKGGWTMSVYMLDSCFCAKQSTLDHEGTSDLLRRGNLL